MKSLRSVLIRVSQFAWGAALFTLPFNVSKILWQLTIFEQGSFESYTGFGIYVSEPLVWVAFLSLMLMKGLGGEKFGTPTKLLKGIGLALVLVAIACLVAEDRISATLNSVHLVSVMMGVLLITEKVLSVRAVQTLFVGTMALQGILAIGQSLTQGSLGLNVLGESLIGRDIAGIAKIEWGGYTLVRAYGTFPHANILSGYLLIGLLLLKKMRNDLRPSILWGSAVLMVTALFLAFSKGALLALLAVIAVDRISQKKTREHFQYGLGLILIGVGIMGLTFFANQEWVNERIELMEISSNMLWGEPQGVGFHQFTQRMQEFSIAKLQPWQFQPVHNVFLLMANELGIWTLALVLWAGVIEAKKNFKKHREEVTWVLALAVIGLFDHYPASLYQGLMLTAIVIGLFLAYCKTEPAKSG